MLFVQFFVPPFLSRFVTITDSNNEPIVVHMTRTMELDRWKMVMSCIIGYAIVMWKCHLSALDVGKLFLLGCITEGSFEFGMYVSGIRTTSFQLVLINTVLECNSGLPWGFLIWAMMLTEEEKGWLSPTKKGR